MKPPSLPSLHATPEALRALPSKPAQAGLEPRPSPSQGVRPPTDRPSRLRGGKLGPLFADGARPPKAPPPRKATCAAECERLEQLPNIGPSIAADLRSLGVEHPSQLAGRDPHALYLALCRLTGKRQDPCVLDTFMAATDFMGGAAPRPWWDYTAQRKARFGVV